MCEVVKEEMCVLCGDTDLEMKRMKRWVRVQIPGTAGGTGPMGERVCLCVHIRQCFPT